LGLHKVYKGYKSYGYLDAGKDFRAFGLVKEIGRVEPYFYPVSKVEEERVQSILEKNIVISLHDHSQIMPESFDELYAWVRSNRFSTGFEGLSVSGVDAVFDGLGDGSNMITSNYPWKWESVVHELGMRLCDIAHQDFVIEGKRVEDILRAHREGKVAFIPHIEGAQPIENELDRVDILYGLGVRCMGLVYSDSNALGSGLRERGDGGLTRFGEQVVERMNKLGMLVDVAHVGDKTSLDAIEVSGAPVVISHAGARAVWNSQRMKPDVVLRALAEKGGVIGIEAAPHTTMSKKHPQHSLESYMDHFEYCAQLMGLDHVTFGPDTIFGDHVGLHHYFEKQSSVAWKEEGDQYTEVAYVKGLENISEYPNIVRWLVTHGYSDDEIAKVVGMNTLRVLEKVWK
jgi:membrane dipeptidase